MEHEAKAMTNFTKTLLATAFLAASTSPALADVAAPDTSAECGSVNLSVYFADEDTALSIAAMTALEAHAEQVAGCEVSTIEATAVSTDGGLILSQARSVAVISALADLGIATVDTSTHIAPTSDGPFLSTARRVDLVLNTLPELATS